MKKLAIILISAIACTSLQAQAPQVSFDHMALVVTDLDKSIEFYTKALGFKKIDDPTGNELIDWVENEAGLQIHFLQGNTSEIRFTKSVHLSFNVDALHPFITNLDQHEVAYESWEGEPSKVTIRPDGVRQIYFQDPDGYWIELNDRSN